MLRRLLCRKPEAWPLDAWIDLYHEEAIDPDVEIIDPHHHLWEPSSQPKGWPVPLWQLKLLYLFVSPPGIVERIKADAIKGGNIKLLRSFGMRQLPFVQPYMGQEFIFDIDNRGSRKRGHNIVKTVYVECGWKEPGVEQALQSVGEARMAESVHGRFPKLCNAVVAFADLCLPDVEKTLVALKQFPSVRGIRHSLAFSEDPDILGADHAKKGLAKDPAFRRGFALLERHGFSYDVWMFHEQLEDLTELARAFPGTTIILDHVAEPLGIGSYDRKTTFVKWMNGIRELSAASKNVYVKLSGMGMLRTGFGFDERPRPPSSKELAEAWGPYFSFVIEAFGVERCMFASNFPVDKVSCDYTVLWNAHKLIVKGRTEAERRALFYETAQKVYRL